MNNGKIDFNASKAVWPATGEVDIPIGWYQFPREANSGAPIFEYVGRQLWSKATKPPEPAARVLFTPNAAFCIEYRSFCSDLRPPNHVCVARYVRITRAFGLNQHHLRFVSKWQPYASEVIVETFERFLNLRKKQDGSVDKSAIAQEIEEILGSAPDRSQIIAYKDWIFKGLANTIHQIFLESKDFFGFLFRKYTEIGGICDQQAFQISMGLLLHIFKPAVRAGVSKHLRPDGNSWRSEREILNCWEVLAQTKMDAYRYIAIMRDSCDLSGPGVVSRHFEKL